MPALEWLFVHTSTQRMPDTPQGQITFTTDIKNICINALSSEISSVSPGTEHGTDCINSISASEEHYNIDFLLMSQTKLETNNLLFLDKF